MRITIEDYDPSWAKAGAAAIAELVLALPGLLTAIEHIGSTSVPGMPAKPVIDLMAASRDLDAVRARDLELETLGYRQAETGMPGRLFYERRQGAGPSHHLHVVTTDTWPTRNERLLRDHLRQHPADASRYADLKRRLAASCETADAYTRGKTSLIQEFTDRARAAVGLPSEPVWEE